MADTLGLDFISVLGMPPIEFIELTASLGCQHISFDLAPITANPHHYPRWSFRDEPQLRRDVVKALNDSGLLVTHCEGPFLGIGKSPADFASDLDIMVELGIPQIGIVSLITDPAQAMAEVAELAEMAQLRGLRRGVEFLPKRAPGSLRQTQAMLAAIGDAEMMVVIDLMHHFRSGGTVNDLAMLDPALIAHIQLCDVPLVNDEMTYGDESLHHRLIPGEGELPLLAALKALPRDITIGLEIPMLTQAMQNIGPHQRLAPAVTAARALLAQRDEGT